MERVEKPVKPQHFKGEFYTDELRKIHYATDASAYRELPAAVAFPKDEDDIKLLVNAASKYKTGLIPRAAGTSLAGQVVGSGIVTDVTKYMNRILEIDEKERYVRVQPGVVRDELNATLKEYGLFFAPETSTSNRTAIGGMAGNNSCGANSVMYGTTRDKLLEVKAVLSDGSSATFKSLSTSEFNDKVRGVTAGSDRERRIYENIKELLYSQSSRDRIRERYPKPEIPRRNHGYALDLLMDCNVFEESDKPFNFCKLIAGSEGTLAFITELKLRLDPLPPENEGLLCAHFSDLYESLEAAVAVLDLKPYAAELMDHHILERTAGNLRQRENRFFVEGTPRAVLIVQFRADSEEELSAMLAAAESRMRERDLGYAYPAVRGSDCNRVWELRKAGLGLLSNKPGDDKPAPVIEDTAVDVKDLPRYIREFNGILKKYDLDCVHYAHAGAGELHLRPVLNLKTYRGQELFRTVLEEVAALVKQYRGCLSGEHGDGRLRGEFIRFMLGDEIYADFKSLKAAWDPENVMNPGKITDTPPMNTSLRYEADIDIPEAETFFRFDREKGFLRAAEMCNGSGDCRKTEIIGGTMCPTYHATRDEAQTTRARANTIREVFTRNPENAFTSQNVKSVTDTCIGCKGCRGECPSNVDLTKLKAEFDYQYQKRNGFSLRTRMTAGFDGLALIGSRAPALFNALFSGKFTSAMIKSVAGIAPRRSMPKWSSVPLIDWYRKNYRPPRKPIKEVYLFADIFTRYLDAEIGIAAVKLLAELDYHVRIIPHADSGRTYLSKGMLPRAKKRAEANIDTFSPVISRETPLIGIEPSALLSFRDEYPDLVSPDRRDKAIELGKNCLLFEEFISREYEAGNISSALFRSEPEEVRIHGHCHQKALSSESYIKKVLSIAPGVKPLLIPSGCCGMAGSFGYSRENFEMSMKIGELKLFPVVRQTHEQVVIAPGHSCRHQIVDGTGRKALHPAEFLYGRLKSATR